MSPVKAILLGAVIVAVSVFLTESNHAAVAFAGGPYQLMQHSNTTAAPGVFKLDMTTGEVNYCYVMGANSAELTCSKPVK